MRLSTITLLSLVAILVAACSSGGATATPAASDAASTRIAVQLTDALKIEPASMSVPVGVPVTFVVTNAGTAEHEFYLGDEAAQAAHEKEMAEMGGMTHDEPDGIAVEPGATKELTYTFDAAGKTLAGCHVVGHYGAGMKADITVGP